jgi:hypothetical protein
MKKKKNKTIKNVHSSDATSQKIPPIADSDESSIDFLDEKMQKTITILTMMKLSFLTIRFGRPLL